MSKFARVDRLPPYVFAQVNELKMKMRHAGADIIDLGMGNPDVPTPKPILDKIAEAAYKPGNSKYSASKGIKGLRRAIRDWYLRRYDVSLDDNQEVCVTMGAKEGLAHLALAMLSPGDVVLAPDPAYPIHPYASIIAGADVRRVPIGPGQDFFENLETAVRHTWPKPKLLIINFPHNPTTQCVELPFFQRIVDFAKEHGLYVVHDLAYADFVFDGYTAPSFMQAEGAKDVGVEFFSMTKSYSMAGMRVGFCVGNQDMVQALTRIKSYLDYGIYQPIQIAATCALNGDLGENPKFTVEDMDQAVKDIMAVYADRRDALCEGLNRIGWAVTPPKATMFLWAPIPDEFKHMGSVEFSKMLLQEAEVAVSPGLGFGEYGDDHVRFSFVENRHRTNQAVRNLRKFFGKG
ncbi:MAG: aminotransferase class I/II-fold pyridoxal phosphate-dependent enzyme [Pseudodesulfovibrio sp.]|uniref:Aminotransferase n=1 Tax=Pseudodesulfovibrio aespoeensis (strain ATCC 700646 / DSM 10631 / Aspo-2) TaxID=643562 RepID=E6VW09_PSEA9|nr:MULTISPECIES: aminotransferase class I/II-fold pyridoxal phosphate-dependent enzyme [Pseudodesulfovibrio]MBU4244621.1 aminotransferase class I/II-fold pyridoxal phosphate-dependent enzyme [Pseudomonadota bacterium]ADU62454.1 aminotransferase class I and II [Pseudodesulfovibrio aespoeensis Aspo-2]MBU4377788.1 aminotransferase class I/II-fold pyridoxal phosphate-dependent enzyme [Pseudomonadota bacterium]MBU4476705.1 aminotransferase class I/II-fold pyridoxal phosphate-dependent enzyme [Pseudo